MTDRLANADELAARIPDGAKVALPPDYSYCAMSVARALVRRGAKDLHLVGVPVFGYQGDMLIGAGCVGTVETSAVTLGENGLAPRFTAAVKAARLGLHLREVDVANRARIAGRSKVSGTVKGVVFAGTKIIGTIARHA